METHSVGRDSQLLLPGSQSERTREAGFQSLRSFSTELLMKALSQSAARFQSKSTERKKNKQTKRSVTKYQIQSEEEQEAGLATDD